MKKWLLSLYTLIYPLFALTNSSKSFQTGCRCLASFSLQVVSSPKHAAAVRTPVYLFPPNILPSSKWSDISWSDHLDPILPLLLYIKPPFPINKQFRIDSFLDWEGLHWDFSSMFTSPPISILFRLHSNAEASHAILCPRKLQKIIIKTQIFI